MSTSRSVWGLNDIVRFNARPSDSFLKGRRAEFTSILPPLSLSTDLMLSEPKYGRPSSTLDRLIVILCVRKSWLLPKLISFEEPSLSANASGYDWSFKPGNASVISSLLPKSIGRFRWSRRCWIFWLEIRLLCLEFTLWPLCEDVLERSRAGSCIESNSSLFNACFTFKEESSFSGWFKKELEDLFLWLFERCSV